MLWCSDSGTSFGSFADTPTTITMIAVISGWTRTHPLVDRSRHDPQHHRGSMRCQGLVVSITATSGATWRETGGDGYCRMAFAPRAGSVRGQFPWRAPGPFVTRYFYNRTNILRRLRC